MFDELVSNMTLLVEQTRNNYSILACIIILPCFFYLLSLLTAKRICLLGIHPRRLYGLWGIIFAPLLHAHFNHLFFNLIPLVVLSNFILIQGLTIYLKLTLFIAGFSGFLIWCFGKPGVHIGASALITGYWAYLVSNSLQEASFTAILLGLLSLYYFAGLFFGIFPGKKGVSWEGHLFGLLAGIVGNILTNRHLF